MTPLRIILQGDGCWPDLARKQVLHVTEGLQVAALPGGMESGRPSVMLRVDLPDGSVVLAEMSLRALLTAARALSARYGEEPPPRGEDA